MPIHKDLLMKVTAVLFALLLVNKMAALELDPEKIRVTPPDTDIAVVQNKYFTKSFRPELGLFGGKIMNEAYRNLLRLQIRPLLHRIPRFRVCVDPNFCI